MASASVNVINSSSPTLTLSRFVGSIKSTFTVLPLGPMREIVPAFLSIAFTVAVT